MNGETVLSKPAWSLAGRFGLITESDCLLWLHHVMGRCQHAATSQALPHGGRSGVEPSLGFVLFFCEHVSGRARAYACVLHNEQLHCQLLSNYTCCLCFSEVTCVLPLAPGEQQAFSTPRVYICHSQKWMIE